jgi:hypothetical protein
MAEGFESAQLFKSNDSQSTDLALSSVSFASGSRKDCDPLKTTSAPRSVECRDLRKGCWGEISAAIIEAEMEGM